MKEQLRTKFSEFMPIIIIGIALLVYIVAGAGEFGLLKNDILTLESGWSVNGEAADTLPQAVFTEAGNTTQLSTTLDGNFSKSMSVCFHTVYQDVVVSLDGEEIYSFHKPEREKLTKAPPSFWNVAYLPGGCEGSELEVVLSTPYQKYSNRIPAFFAGEPSQISRFVSMKTVPPFVAALAVLFVGLVFALIAVNVRQYIHGQTGLYSLSLFIVVLAVFLASQQTNMLMSIFGGTSYILLQNISLMLCPVLYTRYLMRVSKGIKRKVAGGLLIASVVNLLLISLLQLLRVRDMPEMLSSTRNLCVIAIIYVFILEIRQQRRIMILLFGALLVYVLYYFYLTGTVTYLVYLGIFAYLYVIVYRVVAEVIRTKAGQIRLEGELEASRSEIAVMQITSHFFYHTLDSIRALIRLDSDKAYKMTGDFAKYIRHRVDGMDSHQETVSFAKELRSIRAYTDIKQAQLGDRFKMIFDIETDEFEILALSVQPLVENAVIHAMQLRREGGLIYLICRETQSGYHIEVIDNGCGAKSGNLEEHEQKRSIAIGNVNKRLEYYGIAPLKFRENELGGMTVSLDTPKKIVRKGTAE